MNRLVSVIIILTLLMTIACKQERPQTGTQTIDETPPSVGIDVPLEKAKEKILGKWQLYKVSKWYKDYNLGLPASLEIKKDKTYVFHITLIGKGKLSYKGKWKILKQGKHLMILMGRTHRAFEGDWKEAAETEGGVIRFLDDKYEKIIFNIVNFSWHRSKLNEEMNNYWKKIKNTGTQTTR